MSVIVDEDEDDSDSGTMVRCSFDLLQSVNKLFKQLMNDDSYQLGQLRLYYSLVSHRLGLLYNINQAFKTTCMLHALLYSIFTLLLPYHEFYIYFTFC